MNTKLPAEELTEELEETAPPAPKPARAPRSPEVSPPSALRETASLIHLIQANMREQSDRIGHLQETHERHNSILTEIISKFEAMADLQEDHMASLEEALERMETVTAAYIRMIERQTNQQRRNYEPPQDMSQNS